MDFVVCTLGVKKKSGQVSTCRIGPFPCESESYVTTDVQSASLPSNKSRIWGLRPDFVTVTQLQVC
jgi:hypothetical protein